MNWLSTLLGTNLVEIGGTNLTLWSVVKTIILAALLFYLSKRLHRWLSENFLRKRGVDVGVRQAIGRLARYVTLVFGFFIILHSTGIDLSELLVIGGAIGIGVGLGLQQTANDFFSGLILLLERPIKVGDRVEVDETVGDVIKIGLRATTIVTNDNIAMILPNSRFTSNAVTNWTHGDRDVRFHIDVGVSYGSDPDLVADLLREAARGHPGVLAEPPPDVIFTGFGDSSLNFRLRIWTDSYITRPAILKSDIFFAILKIFREHKVEIPFPQRDVHIRSGNTQTKSI